MSAKIMLTTAQLKFVRELLDRCDSRNPEIVSYIEGSPGCFGDADENAVIEEMQQLLRNSGNKYATQVIYALDRFKC